MRRLLTFTVVLLFAASASGQIRLTHRGKAAARIVVVQQTPANRTAAQLLARFVGEASGASLPVVCGVEPRRDDVVIGAADTAQLTEDGFRLRCADGVLRVSSGGDKGAVYGVVTLLERFLGMTYYAAGVYDLDRRPTVELPAMDFHENPAFRYRQSQGYGMAQDSTYRLFLRLEEPEDLFAGGLWVHTFDRLLPASVYGKEHPEYYSHINGERRPGRASQWCLTNGEVFSLAAAKIDSVFAADPLRRMISVSQNDSNFTYCRCAACEKVNEEEGAPSGNYIRFLNRLAERFPDKEFSTLAYLFTMQPPKHVRPLPNVNIMLCSIDCDREVPLTDNASGRKFVRALEGWSALTDNLFVWDYGINFDNMVAPFPNFPVLGPNMRLFRRHGARMHFSQVGGSYGGDFSELRTWVVAKLLWNPEQDTDSLLRRFMRGYYGPAAPYLYDYEKLLEGALLASGQRLWIYDSPVSNKEGMLRAACRKRYHALFDRAERTVSDDSVLLRRVHLARLPLYYSELEIARTEPQKDLEQVVRTLETFERHVTRYGVETLNERNNSPAEYCRLYRQRYLPANTPNKALGARVEWLVPPAEKYRGNGGGMLTDGLFGGATFVEGWTGWEGCDGGFIVDLGREETFTHVETDFLHQLGSWVLLPRAVSYAVSSDGENYRPLGRKELAEDRSVPVKFVAAGVTSPEPVRARYIRVDIEGVKTCPAWHYGVGCPCWFFADEVTVR